jgi:hypothetical protein
VPVGVGEAVDVHDDRDHGEMVVAVDDDIAGLGTVERVVQGGRPELGRWPELFGAAKILEELLALVTLPLSPLLACLPGHDAGLTVWSSRY